MTLFSAIFTTASRLSLICTAQLLTAALASIPTALAAAAPNSSPLQLGGPEFTKLGAERRGNSAGTIPAWTGGLTEPPASYRRGRHEPDPFPDDQILYSISAVNAGDYAELLSPGQSKLLTTYPNTWRYNVYPSRRTASFPQWVYDAVVANATRASLAEEGRGGARGSRVSSPFPVPKRGEEVIWNHNLRWRGIRVQRSLARVAVTRRGKFNLVLGEVDIGFPYGVAAETAFTRRYPNMLLAFKSKTISPALIANEATLVIEPIDQSVEPRKTWLYKEALRRVVRAPFFRLWHARSQFRQLAHR